MLNNDNDDDDDDSRALLYYASPETIVSSSGQNDLYGRIIEKKRVGLLKNIALSLVALFLYSRISFALSFCLLLLLLCAPYSIFLLDHLNYNVNHLYVTHAVMHVFTMYLHFTPQIYLKQSNKNHHL